MSKVRDNELILAGRMLGRKPSALRKAMEELWNPDILEKEIFIVVDGVLANYPDHFFTYLGLDRAPLRDMADPRLVMNYYKVHGDEEFWLTIPPLEKFYDLPTSGYICRRHPDLNNLTSKWLRIHGYPDAPLLNIWKRTMLETVPKSAFILEDDAAACEKLRGNGFKCFLIDRPWNQEYKTDARVYSVKEFYERVMQKTLKS